jgi:hypothetical protein
VTRITIHQETPSRLLRRDLQCVARSIEVNLTSHQSLVSIERLHATDMAGTIRAIQQLDPDVTRIDVFCHDAFDIAYVHEDARWLARSHIRA